MSLASIVFGDYVFPICKKIEIEDGKNIKEIQMPTGSCVLEELGKRGRIINGLGEFVGEDKYSKYIDLYEEFDKGGYRKLNIPGFLPVDAYFSKLNMIAGKNGKSVEFEFRFVCRDREDLNEERGYYEIKTGDNLWMVANMFDITIDELMMINNFFVNPFDVSVGERVRVK